jgi:cytochrome d ubiquinol oxidase subunit I
VKGLDAFPRDLWPDNIPLLYFSYHLMVGLGTVLIAVIAASMLQLARRKVYHTRWLLWILMLSFPLPYIATTASWITPRWGASLG